ncbi:MAG: hypothetical protein P8X51_12310 [Maritimibacter sp.]|jgi:hypothetical protein
MTSRTILLTAALLVAFWLTSFLGLPEALGAHPWWAVKSGVIGSVIGAAAVIGWRLLFKNARGITWIALAGLIAAGFSAVLGKQEFAASYAENALAGRFWFFGWIAISACLFALLASILIARFGR